MPRTMLFSVVLLSAGLVWPGLICAGEPGLKQTIDYVRDLQTNTGGFLSMAPQPNIRIAPTLKATSAAVRGLHYLGGDLKDKPACIKFVESCFDAASGGFADFPRGTPDVFTTAVGIMAVTELKMPVQKFGPAAAKYLDDHAKGFDDIRIAVAGLERLNAKAPRAQAWLDEVRKSQNDDGSFGKGPGQARATGSAVVTLLRLGSDLPQRDAVLKVLREGQRPSGGFGKDDDEIASDLETSYRVMRCFMMLKARPKSAEGMRSFVAKCRNADGGYGMAPGQPSNVNATYFAAIIKHWLKEKK
jgi:prenyltransferase beta subunit